MAAVVIDSGPVSATQRREDVPVDRWRQLVAARRDFCNVKLSYDCRELLHFVEEAEEMVQPLGYADLNDFIRRGLELDPQLVTWAVDGLRRLKPDTPIPFTRAVALGKREIGVEGGKAGPGRGKKTSDRVTRFIERGNSAAYYLARLDRDHYDDLAAQVRAGTLKAKVAARLAGIIRTQTPLDHLQHWWARASASERGTFRRWADAGGNDE
jgi:hypothetical protein